MKLSRTPLRVGWPLLNICFTYCDWYGPIVVASIQNQTYDLLCTWETRHASHVKQNLLTLSEPVRPSRFRCGLCSMVVLFSMLCSIYCCVSFDCFSFVCHNVISLSSVYEFKYTFGIPCFSRHIILRWECTILRQRIKN